MDRGCEMLSTVGSLPISEMKGRLYILESMNYNESLLEDCHQNLPLVLFDEVSCLPTIGSTTGKKKKREIPTYPLDSLRCIHKAFP